MDLFSKDICNIIKKYRIKLPPISNLIKIIISRSDRKYNEYKCCIGSKVFYMIRISEINKDIVENNPLFYRISFIGDIQHDIISIDEFMDSDIVCDLYKCYTDGFYYYSLYDTSEVKKYCQYLIDCIKMI
jgi:hypothetical protein